MCLSSQKYYLSFSAKSCSKQTLWVFSPKSVEGGGLNPTRPRLLLLRNLKSPALSSLWNLQPSGNHIGWTPVSLPASYLMI